MFKKFIAWVIKKVFGVAIVISIGKADRMTEHKARHRAKVQKVLDEM